MPRRYSDRATACSIISIMSVIAAVSGRARLIFQLAALIALLVAQQFLAVPGSGRLAHGLHNSAHGPWFAFVTWLLLLFWSRRYRGWSAVAITAITCLILATLTEVLQKFTGGAPSLGDFAFDLVGATAALFAWCGRASLLSHRSSYWMAGLLLMVTPAPILQALAVEWHRTSIAPDLVRFDSPFQGELIGANSHAVLVAAPGGWPIAPKVLKITLADTTWPGVHLDEPIADWQPYATLAVDIYVEGAQPLPIIISVRLDNAPVDHVYRPFECAPGPCRLLLPLGGLFDRDRARVNAVVIYSTRDAAGRTLYLGRVALLKAQ